MVRNASQEEGSLEGVEDKSGAGVVKGKGMGKSKKLMSKSGSHKMKINKNRSGSAPSITQGVEVTVLTERDGRPKSRPKKHMESQAAAVFGEKAATLGLYA